MHGELLIIGSKSAAILMEASFGSSNQAVYAFILRIPVNDVFTVKERWIFDPTHVQVTGLICGSFEALGARKPVHIQMQEHILIVRLKCEVLCSASASRSRLGAPPRRSQRRRTYTMTEFVKLLLLNDLPWQAHFSLNI